MYSFVILFVFDKYCLLWLRIWWKDFEKLCVNDNNIISHKPFLYFCFVLTAKRFIRYVILSPLEFLRPLLRAYKFIRELFE